MALITVENLQKRFLVAVRKSGPLAAVRSLLAREYREVAAVDQLSFRIEAAEMVGYIGPNGAGKSTTIKMLAGILVPSAGQISVNGRIPHQQRKAHVRGIGVVFGQRSQLWWDLPTIESFELLQHIYAIPVQRWRENLAHFSRLLDLEPFLHTPVRQLSLGQRMRADLAAALLHDPVILFLDEPTIGLDLVARERMREFLLQINRERGITMLLTTHDLADIARLCPRVLLIDHGRLMYDGALEALHRRFGRQRLLVADFEQPPGPIQLAHAELLRQEGLRAWFRFDREAISAAALIAELARQYALKDLMIEEPAIEAVIRNIYEHGLDL